MIERFCPNCGLKIDRETCPGDNCDGCKTVSKKTIYWCDTCKVPIFDCKCSVCGSEGEYLATDVRPVFPEEKLLLSIVTDKDKHFYDEKSVWAANNKYYVDGKKINLPISKLNKTDLETIAKFHKEFEDNKNSIDSNYFEKNIELFVKANKKHFDYLVGEASDYIRSYQDKFDIDEMMVSFSGGKDSTVVSNLVTNALSTKKIIHIFGDTTLEFPMTLEYKKRFKKNSESQGITMLTAKNREKNFEELCDVIGPPSRVMRWCCTVFKTGAIQRMITLAFKNKTKILSFQGIRHSESVARSKYERESDSPKITKQTVVAPIIDWIDFDVWLYILTTGIDFNDAYKLGYTRVGCWCCPNNGSWSEFLSKVHMYDQFIHWRKLLVDFAKKIGKPDPEVYIDDGNWKARQGGDGLDEAKKSIIEFEPCATTENAFNYELQKPITEEFYELFKPFGYLNYDLGNKRLGEVYVLDKKGSVVLILQGRIGSTKLKVTIKNPRIAKSKNVDLAERKIKCQLTKYQMCLGCKACESVCKHDAIIVKEEKTGNIVYKIDDDKCVRCTECVGHFSAGCYMRKVLTIKRG